MSKKIMLVEDDINLREIYGARLLAEGYEIVSAQDGEAALAMAVKERPDLIISDVMMPKISGFDMLDILRSTPETKNTKVVMMTALSQAEDKKRADELGADKYLVKSQVTLEDVARVVHELLGDESQSPVQNGVLADQDIPESQQEQTSSVPIKPENQQLPEVSPEIQPISEPTQPINTNIEVKIEPESPPEPVLAAPSPGNAQSDDTQTQDQTADADQTDVASVPPPPLPPSSEPSNVVPIQTNASQNNVDESGQLVEAEIQVQASPSVEQRAEVGDQIADAIAKDLTTAPLEVPVTVSPVEAPQPPQPAESGSKKIIKPLDKPEERHITEIAADEDRQVVVKSDSEELKAAQEIAANQTSTPAAPAQPDKYTIPEPTKAPEETDPNVIAL